MPDRYEAIIIGGGPAGALAACLLARSGWRVLLIEKRAAHQPKTCGHCLDHRANATLRRAGLLQRVRAIASGITTAASIHLPDAAPLHWPIAATATAHLLIVQRSRLDQLLINEAQAAGCDILQPAAARIIRVGRTNVITAQGRTCRAPLLIGADGLQSRVARAARLGRSTAAGQRKYGFSFQCSCADDAARQLNLNRAATHLFVIPQGYLGIVHHHPRQLHLAGLVSHSRLSPPDFLHHIRQRFPHLAPVLKQPSSLTAAGPMPFRPAAVASPSAALIGDAAGYIEPFTGQGMTWALQSAELLADIAARAGPGQWSAKTASIYESQWRNGIGRSQRFCQTMAFALDHPRLIHALIAFSHRRPALARRFAQQVLAA